MKKPLFFCLGLAGLAILILTFSGGVRTSFQPLPVYQMDTTEKAILVTFNVLWEVEEELEKVLSFLNNHEIEAIFFVTGDWIKKFPGLAFKILEQGHYLGNRSMSHRKLTLLTEEEIIKEIDGFNRVCGEMLDYNPVFFRPPHGEYNALIVRLAREAGCVTLLWSINARTFKENEASFVINHMEERLHPGAIILFHLSPGVCKLLPLLFDFLAWKGYEIVSPKKLLK